MDIRDLTLMVEKYGRTFLPDEPKTKRPYTRKADKPQPQAPPTGPDGFTCDLDGCGRAFPKIQGYRMHQFRTHGIRVT
jgi:hypothetical protein